MNRAIIDGSHNVIPDNLYLNERLTQILSESGAVDDVLASARHRFMSVINKTHTRDSRKFGKNLEENMVLNVIEQFLILHGFAKTLSIFRPETGLTSAGRCTNNELADYFHVNMMGSGSSLLEFVFRQILECRDAAQVEPNQNPLSCDEIKDTEDFSEPTTRLKSIRHDLNSQLLSINEQLSNNKRNQISQESNSSVLLRAQALMEEKSARQAIFDLETWKQTELRRMQVEERNRHHQELALVRRECEIQVQTVRETCQKKLEDCQSVCSLRISQSEREIHQERQMMLASVENAHEKEMNLCRLDNLSRHALEIQEHRIVELQHLAEVRIREVNQKGKDLESKYEEEMARMTKFSQNAIKQQLDAIEQNQALLHKERQILEAERFQVNNWLNDKHSMLGRISDLESEVITLTCNLSTSSRLLESSKSANIDNSSQVQHTTETLKMIKTQVNEMGEREGKYQVEIDRLKRIEELFATSQKRHGELTRDIKTLQKKLNSSQHECKLLRTLLSQQKSVNDDYDDDDDDDAALNIPVIKSSPSPVFYPRLMSSLPSSLSCNDNKLPIFNRYSRNTTFLTKSTSDDVSEAIPVNQPPSIGKSKLTDSMNFEYKQDKHNQEMISDDDDDENLVYIDSKQEDTVMLKSLQSPIVVKPALSEPVIVSRASPIVILKDPAVVVPATINEKPDDVPDKVDNNSIVVVQSKQDVEVAEQIKPQQKETLSDRVNRLKLKRKQDQERKTEAVVREDDAVIHVQQVDDDYFS